EGGVRLVGRGAFLSDLPIPFEMAIDYAHDDRISGGARFVIPGANGSPGEPLRTGVEGLMVQDPGAGSVWLTEGTRMTIGRLPFRFSGSLRRDGPQVRVHLAADGLTQERLVRNLPRALLGPLEGLAVRGSFDYRLD